MIHVQSAEVASCLKMDLEMYHEHQLSNHFTAKIQQVTSQDNNLDLENTRLWLMKALPCREEEHHSSLNKAVQKVKVVALELLACLLQRREGSSVGMELEMTVGIRLVVVKEEVMLRKDDLLLGSTVAKVMVMRVMMRRL
jgi:hypothetical protein